ncbi:MAG: cytochrome c biogenesis protein CcsA [Terriglobales bacterium]
MINHSSLLARSTWAFAATLALLLLALWWALIASPSIYVATSSSPAQASMAITYRIFYYHAPAGMTAFVVLIGNALASIAYLVRRSRRADALALACAEVGLAFLTINLITGPIWAHPAWGVWWVWDPRLTLTLALWVMFASYLILRQLTPPGALQPRLAAVLSVFFAADVPIDYMAIRWWRNQHPSPVVFGGPNSGMAPRMWVAFGLSFSAFLALAVCLVWLRYRQELTRARLVTLRQQRLLAQEV